MQTSKKEFHTDKSIIYHHYYVQPSCRDVQYKVGYIDLRGNRKEVMLPLENEEPNYEDFLQQKALQHCKDYNEYVSVRELNSYLIKTETTYGTDPVPSAFTKTVTYKKGDKFTLDGYTCVVTDVEKKRNYSVTSVWFEETGMGESWEVNVWRAFKNTKGKVEECYTVCKQDAPELRDYKTNEDWYDALMEVVNKKC